jgi:hypothetical protein
MGHEAGELCDLYRPGSVQACRSSGNDPRERECPIVGHSLPLIRYVFGCSFRPELDKERLDGPSRRLLPVCSLL